jgi:mannose-6-phosphate isomerase-like protein (cupin superfamily)
MNDAIASVTRPQYTVKNIEPIAMGSDVQARRFTLGAGEAIPWHFHSEVADWYVCLAGRLTVETRAPRDRVELAPGGTYRIPPKRAHHISNRSGEDCEFMLIQGVGRNDFHLVGQSGAQPDAVQAGAVQPGTVHPGGAA